MEIIRINSENVLEIETLLRESANEGFTMLEELVDQYNQNPNIYCEAHEALLVAMDEYGNYLGVACIGPDELNQSCALIDYHYVLPSYRTMGVGLELFDWLMKTAEADYNEVIIRRKLSDSAKSFYINRGFEENKDKNQILKIK